MDALEAHGATIRRAGGGLPFPGTADQRDARIRDKWAGQLAAYRDAALSANDARRAHDTRRTNGADGERVLGLRSSRPIERDPHHRSREVNQRLDPG